MFDQAHYHEWQERHCDILVQLTEYCDGTYDDFLHLFYRGYNERYIEWITHNFGDLILLYHNCFSALGYPFPQFLSLAYRSTIRK